MTIMNSTSWFWFNRQQKSGLTMKEAMMLTWSVALFISIGDLISEVGIDLIVSTSIIGVLVAELWIICSWTKHSKKPRICKKRFSFIKICHCATWKCFMREHVLGAFTIHKALSACTAKHYTLVCKSSGHNLHKQQVNDSVTIEYLQFERIGLSTALCHKCSPLHVLAQLWNF